MNRNWTVQVSAAALASALLVHCGSSDNAQTAVGSAGAAGNPSGAGAGGKVSAGGGQGGEGLAGHPSGAGAGGAGRGGAGGPGGAAGHPASGHGGASGASGQGGHAGASGAAGSAPAGHGGAAGGCSNDAACSATVLPPTTPAGCAVAFCDLTTQRCAIGANDADGDGHRAASCTSDDPNVKVLIGDDCNDQDPDVHPGAWDGPADGTKPSECNGVDDDCDGVVDDGQAANGATCVCTPGDTASCASDPAGKPVDYPTPTNALLGSCKLGVQTCGSDGKQGPCIGAIGPSEEVCDDQQTDENCNGFADMLDLSTPPTNTITWSYDGDSDGYAAPGSDVRQQACSQAPPAHCPVSIPACDPKKWVSRSLPQQDCDDTNEAVNPLATEICNGIDDNCDGHIDTDAVNAPSWVFDYDGDQYADVNTLPLRQCAQPTTLPSVCDALTDGAMMWTTYCAGAGFTGEGAAPDCSANGGTAPPPCAATMWTTSPLPRTDCKDNPSEGTALDGNKPALVYPSATDICNGHDYNCNGTASEGCGCPVIGAMAACGSSDTCNAGQKTCLTGGIWSSCDGGDAKQKYAYCPDADNDHYCVLSQCTATELCPAAAPAGSRPKYDCTAASVDDCADTDPAINPGAFEQCDGVDNNCDGTIDENYGVGTDCYAPPNQHGACYRKGSEVCNPAHSAAECNVGAWGDVPTQTATTTALRGSFDVDCDGITTYVATNYRDPTASRAPPTSRCSRRSRRTSAPMASSRAPRRRRPLRPCVNTTTLARARPTPRSGWRPRATPSSSAATAPTRARRSKSALRAFAPSMYRLAAPT